MVEAADQLEPRQLAGKQLLREADRRAPTIAITRAVAKRAAPEDDCHDDPVVHLIYLLIQH
jgi:hypothetical protein